jgi:hypothetical protein
VEYRFEPRKDARLRATRGRGFVEIIALIEAGHLLEVVPHPHPERYPGQSIAEVLVDDYVYRVPFRPNADGTVWELITLFPNRRATRAWRTRRP